MDALLRRVLGARPPVAESPDCLDAESLAAWMDGGLDDETRAAVVAHSAGCERCQAMLGVMAHATPEVPVPQPWWRRQWTWLVPLTAGAAAVTVWMVVPAQCRWPIASRRGRKPRAPWCPSRQPRRSRRRKTHRS
jgi:hypothetical protein